MNSNDTANDFLEQLRQMHEEQQKSQRSLGMQPSGWGTCPSCGHCPHCGRGGYGTMPSWPRPYIGDPWITWTVS